MILLPTAGVAFGSGQLLMAADPATTLENIQANRTFFELAIVLGAVGFIDYLLVALVLHRLFSPTGQAAANVLLALVAVSVPISLAAMAQRMDVLLLLDGAQGLPSLGTDQGRTQVMHAMHSSNNLILVSAIFWGLWLVPFGWLVLRSGFMPRVLGILLLIGSVFYVLAFAGPVLDTDYPNSALARVVGFATGVPGILGELGTALWLLIMGGAERKTTVRSAPAV